jgi:retron-type reverse transcriptase
VVKAFDTVWVDGLIYKLAVLTFPSYLLRIIISYRSGRTFEASFQTATSSHHGMRAGVAQGGIISPVLFSLYVNDMPIPFRHVELALYTDDTAVMATSCKPELLVSYLESYLSDLERWLKNGGSPSTSLRALRRSLLAGTSKNPDQYNSSGSQSYGLIQPVILE